MYAFRKFPGATVHALCDGVGPFFRPRTEAFPGVSVETWGAADRLDPEAAGGGGGDGWVLHFHAYAIRFDSGRTVVVDAGIGPAGAPAGTWAPVPGDLPAQLDLAGIVAADVDTVVLTHLHTDHVGWAAAGLFPAARHIVQRADADAVAELNPSLEEVLLRPLRDDGRLDVVEGDVTLAPALEVRHLPGHTPGQQIVVLSAGAERLAIASDLVLHAVQLVDPATPYVFDADANAARAARTALLAELAAGGGVLAASHPTATFIEIGTGGTVARP
jgi:glyoxylase-like metal-dependent hydrolase (beta-lactamase superfamily II)